MNIDIKARNMQAAALTEELTGGPSLRGLVQTMLDHEVPPVFMWRPIAAPLAEEAEALRSSLESAISSNAAQGRAKEVLAGIPALERDIAKAVLQMATSPGYFEIPDGLLGVPSKSSRVFSALPNLAERLDERGLLHLAGLRATPRAVFIDGYAHSYHQLLRRGFSSHVNDALLEYLLRLGRENGLQLRAAIDERRLRLSKHYREWLERDYWYGPPLTEGALDSDDRTPTTLVHRWADNDDPRRIFDSSEQFALRLTCDGGIRTVEAEELVVSERGGSNSPFVLVRYLHAQRDVSRRQFIHCDGAVRAYLPDVYARRRLVQGFPQSDGEAPTRYRKVFRADGDISTNEWSQIVALWFRGNHLALEVLGQLGTVGVAAVRG